MHAPCDAIAAITRPRLLRAQVTGLKGLTYLDKSKDANKPEKKTESRDAITFTDTLVDTVYLNAPEHVELEVGTGERRQKRGAACCGGAAGVLVTSFGTASGS